MITIIRILSFLCCSLLSEELRNNLVRHYLPNIISTISSKEFNCIAALNLISNSIYHLDLNVSNDLDIVQQILPSLFDYMTSVNNRLRQIPKSEEEERRYPLG